MFFSSFPPPPVAVPADDWRPALFDEIERGLRSRFGDLLLFERAEHEGDAALSIFAPSVAVWTLFIRAGKARDEAEADMGNAVDLVTQAYWDAAPIAGRA